MPARISRRWLVVWSLGALLTGAVFVAAGAVLVINQPHSFVIEAKTEALRVPSTIVGIDDSWNVRGARICEERFTDAGFEVDDCGEPETRDMVLVIPSGASLAFQRLVPGVEGRSAGSPSVAVPRQDQRWPAPLEVMISVPGGTFMELQLRGMTEPPTRLAGTVLLTWDTPPMAPLDFRGLAIIGQLPERGNRGVLLDGRASAHMAARAGAPRFEVAGAELVSGDVASVVMPLALSWQVRLLCRLRGSAVCLPPGASRMWGFVRFDPDTPSGFSVVYAGPAERVVVDRLGANFELKPGWAARLRLDPLAQLLYSGASLAAGLLAIIVGLKAGKIIYRDIADRRSDGAGEAGCPPPPEAAVVMQEPERAGAAGEPRETDAGVAARPVRAEGGA